MSLYRYLLILSFFGLVSLAIGLGFQVYWLAAGGLVLASLVGFRNFRFSYIEQMPMSQWALLAFVDVYLLSIIFNWSDYENPWLHMAEALPFVFCFFAVQAFKGIFARVSDRKKLSVIFNLFLSAHALVYLLALLGEYPLGELSPAYLSLVTVILFAMSLKWELSRHLTWLWFLFAVTGLSLFALIDSMDRTALAGFAVGVVVVIFLTKQVGVPSVAWQKRKRGPFILALSLVVVALFSISGAVEEFFPEKIEKREMREAQAQAAILGFQNSPLFGLGHNLFAPKSDAIKILKGLNYPGFESRAPGNFLEFLATKGIVGLMVLVSFMAFWGFELYQRQDLLTQVMLPALVALNITGVFEYTLGEGVYLYLVLILYALSQVEKRWIRT
jgi:hypothetical protein